MSELLKRTITGFALVAIMIAAISTHHLSALILFITITCFSLYEFYGLIKSLTPIRNKFLHTISGGYIVVVSFLGAMQLYSKWQLIPYILYIISLFIMELYKHKNASILNVALALLGHIYIAVPFALLGWFGYLHSETYNPILILALFITIWVNDSGAYLIGSKFGKNRLFERISPKKSWEGFLGGLIFAIAGSLIFAIYNPILPIANWIGFALITSISATYGDLFESLLKRSLGIKDSGNILPGHGGMLDRFDAPLFAIPTVMTYLYFFC